MKKGTFLYTIYTYRIQRCQTLKKFILPLFSLRLFCTFFLFFTFMGPFSSYINPHFFFRGEIRTQDLPHSTLRLHQLRHRSRLMRNVYPCHLNHKKVPNCHSAPGECLYFFTVLLSNIKGN